MSERVVMSVVSSRDRIPLPTLRRRKFTRARRHGLRVCRADDALADYWSLLEATLRERHNVSPVHTLEEIERLQCRFPESIQLYGCFDRDELIAGVLIFESACVARTQYIAAGERGRELCALDLILHYLLNEVFAAKPYFDLGPSHDPATGAINVGLIEQKEGFGGRAVVQDTYWIDLTERQGLR